VVSDSFVSYLATKFRFETIFLNLTLVDSGNWIIEIDGITESFKNEFGGLTIEELNFKASPDTWSIARNIDHLLVINRTYYPVIEAVRENRHSLPWHGRFKFLVNWFGKVILESVSPDRRRKMKTFPLWQPATSQIPGNILETFEDHQHALKDLILSSEDLLARGAVITSPANRNIVYTLAKAFDIIVTHEKRHFEQAKEVKACLPANSVVRR